MPAALVRIGATSGTYFFRDKWLPLKHVPGRPGHNSVSVCLVHVSENEDFLDLEPPSHILFRLYLSLQSTIIGSVYGFNIFFSLKHILIFH